MVAHACNPGYSGGWGRRIAWTWEAEVMVNRNHTIALQPGQQEWNSISKGKKRSWKKRKKWEGIFQATPYTRALSRKHVWYSTVFMSPLPALPPLVPLELDIFASRKITKPKKGRDVRPLLQLSSHDVSTTAAHHHLVTDSCLLLSSLYLFTECFPISNEYAFRYQ